MVLSIATALLLYSASSAQPHPMVRFSIQPESKLWFDGKSTFHDYSCKTSRIDGAIKVDSARAKNVTKDGTTFFDTVEITIPVKSIQSGSDKLDKNMYESLKADANPEITYTLSESSVIPDSSNRNDNFMIKTKGKLKVAGKENLIEMNLRVTKNQNGSIGLTGRKEILMTDFYIEPPTFMLFVKTDNRVVVHFDILLNPQN